MVTNREFVEECASQPERMAYYRRIAQRLVGPDEAEAVVQDAFIKALTTPTSIDQTRNPQSWFARIVQRTALDQLRRTNSHIRRRETSLEAYTNDGEYGDRLGADPNAIDPQQIVERGETIAGVRQAIQSASLTERELFALQTFYRGGQTYEEVIEASQRAGLTQGGGAPLTEGDIKNTLFRGRAKVREKLSSDSTSTSKAPKK